MKLIGIMFLTVGICVAVSAQRPRNIETTKAADASKTVPAPAPATVKVKYEGGVFGYNKTMDGMLSFDDTNRRLLFRNNEQREVFFIPYNAVNSAFADTQKRRPSAATVASNVPYFGFPFGFIKTKVRYVTLQYSDPDTRVSGTTSFRLENKDLVDSVLFTIANKAGLTSRGDVYVRKSDSDEAKKTTP